MDSRRGSAARTWLELINSSQPFLFVAAQIVNRHDIRVLQPCQHFGFWRETREAFVRSVLPQEKSKFYFLRAS